MSEPRKLTLNECRHICDAAPYRAVVRYFTEHQHPRARDGTFMARGQGRDRGKGGPEGKIFDAPPKGGPEAKVFDAKQTTTDAPAKTEVKPELPPGPGEFGHSDRPNAAPMQPPAPPAAPAMSKPPKPGFQERRAKLQERAKKKEAEFEGMTDEERTAHKAERDAKAMVHNARKAKKPAGFIQQLMSHWLGTKNQLGAAKKAAKAKKATPAPTTQPAASQTPSEAPQADANPFAGFHETNIQDRMWDIAEGRHLRHQADGQPVRYMKDASGHEHDEEGLFTGPGDGGTSAEPKHTESYSGLKKQIHERGNDLVHVFGKKVAKVIAGIHKGEVTKEQAKDQIDQITDEAYDAHKENFQKRWVVLKRELTNALGEEALTDPAWQQLQWLYRGSFDSLKTKLNDHHDYIKGMIDEGKLKSALSEATYGDSRVRDELSYFAQNLSKHVKELAEKKKNSADGSPARYSAAECRIRLAMSRRRLLPAGVRG